MPNSKLRCSNCRDYFPRDSFYRPGAHSESCFLEFQQKARNKRARKETNRLQFHRDHKGKVLPVELRRRIRRRDLNRCRYCGTSFDLAVHHIIYRSQGGPDDEHNLITLCMACHELIHSDKDRFMPLCLGYIWALLVEGRQVTIPQLERWAA